MYTNNFSTFYPFSALVGQEEMLEALLLLAIDPLLGGILLLGEKGTAKSTAARALNEILPSIEVKNNCPFNCSPNDDLLCPKCQNEKTINISQKKSPFLNLPLGASIDRLIGGLDWEKTLIQGSPVLQVGLLGEANHGFLYVDEINLLDESLSQLLLDTGGQLILEKDGLSLSHPAQVAIIASANPEEGILSPQLKDRFALTITVTGEINGGQRKEIISRRLEFEKDKLAFRKKYQTQTNLLKTKIKKARLYLKKMTLNTEIKNFISDIIGAKSLQGHRGDLALSRASLARAAYFQRPINKNDVLKVAPWALKYREKVITEIRSSKEPQIIVQAVDKTKPATKEKSEKMFRLKEEPEAKKLKFGPENKEPKEMRVYSVGDTFEIVSPKIFKEKGSRFKSGRRSLRDSNKNKGQAYRTTSIRLGRPWSLVATLRAAAPYQLRRQKTKASCHLIIKPQDIREKVYRQKTGRLILFIVDGSGSVGSLYRMVEAKSAIMSLLNEAYQKRDRVSLITFYGTTAKLLLPPTNSPELAAQLLKNLACGGKTPLAAALVLAEKVLKQELSKDQALTPLIVLMTDGRPNIPLNSDANPWTETLDLAGKIASNTLLNFLLIDTDKGHYNELKLITDLAKRLRAPKLSLEDLRQGKLLDWLNNGY